MPQFEYKAKDSPGHVADGVIQAETPESAIRKLRQDGLYPVSITPITEERARMRPRRLKPRDIITFTRQLANLVHAGFPLTAALGTLAGQERNSGMKQLIGEIHERIQGGATFSDALEASPGLFSSVYVSMVRIGETTGTIDAVLNRLADFKEREGDLTAQIRSALVYPAFVFTVGMLTVFFMLTFFIPKITGIFGDLGQSLPIITRVVMAVSSFFFRFWLLIVLLAAGAAAALRYYYSREQTRIVCDELFLKLPIVGSLIIKVETARLCYALGVLLRNNVPMLSALDVLSTSTQNRLIRAKLRDVQGKIRSGGSFSSCLEAEKIFPLVLIDIVAVGEESGTLDEMLEKSAVAFEKEVNSDVKSMVSLLEPILILCVGGIVMIMAFAMLMPIFQMNFFIR